MTSGKTIIRRTAMRIKKAANAANCRLLEKLRSNFLVNTKSSVTIEPMAYLFIAPFFIIFTYFYFIPIFKVITDSFTDYDIFTRRNPVGINNYIALFNDTRFIRSVGNTLVYTAGSLIPALALGLCLALLINNSRIKTKFSRMLIFMPHVVSMVAVSMIWLFLFEPSNGIFNGILSHMGLMRRNWLLDPSLAMPSLIFMNVWRTMGYMMVIFLAGLKSIPEQYYEAAKIDGSPAVNTFFKITLPMLSPVTSFLFINGLIASFNVFEQVQIMTEGGPMFRTTTIVHQVFLAGFTEYRVGYASAMSVTILIVLSVITLINFKLMKVDL